MTGCCCYHSHLVRFHSRLGLEKKQLSVNFSTEFSHDLNRTTVLRGIYTREWILFYLFLYSPDCSLGSLALKLNSQFISNKCLWLKVNININSAHVLTDGLCRGGARHREVFREVHVAHVAATAAEVVSPILDLRGQVGNHAAVVPAALVVAQVSPATWGGVEKLWLWRHNWVTCCYIKLIVWFLLS